MTRHSMAWLRRGVASLLLLVTAASITVLLLCWRSFLGLCLDWWQSRPSLAVLAAVTALLFAVGLLNLVRTVLGELHAHLLWQRMLKSHDVLPYGRDVSLVESRQFFVFTRGLLRPKTYCSSAFLFASGRKEQQAVLEHEAAHRSRRDPLRRTLWRMLSAALFFLPLLPALERAALTDQECRADGAALVAGHHPGTLLAAVRRAVRHGGTLPYPSASAAFAVHPDLVVRCRILAGEPVSRPVPSRALLGTFAVLAVMLGSIVVLPRSTSAAAQNICEEVAPAQRSRSAMSAWPVTRTPAATTDRALFHSEP